jgi:DNA polymerase I
MKPILLIDGLNAIYRANIKFSKTDPEKPSFNVVFNFFRSLRALIEKFQPIKVFFVLEGSNNFRYKLFADYKANRLIKMAAQDPVAAKDFDRQRDIVLNLLGNLPITMVYADAFEADDVIGTLVENLKDEACIIVSNDTDFLQLLQKGYQSLQIYLPSEKSFAKNPDFHYLAWKCLRGDKKSDNIPGLVSDQEALRLLQAPDDLKKFLGQAENQANFNLNKSLIELQLVPEDQLIFKDYQVSFERLEKEFASMEFETMLAPAYWSRFKETFQPLL